MLALEVPAGNAEKIAKEAFDAGLLINATRPTVLRFTPALNVSSEEIDLMLDTLTVVMGNIDAPADRGGNCLSG